MLDVRYVSYGTYVLMLENHSRAIPIGMVMGRPGTTDDEPKYDTCTRWTDLGARDSYIACDTVFESGCDFASCRQDRVLRVVMGIVKG